MVFKKIYAIFAEIYMKDALKTFTVKFRSLNILVAAMVLALASCTSHEKEDMRNLITLYPEILSGAETVMYTRANTILLDGTPAGNPNIYSDSIPEGTSIAIYAVPTAPAQTADGQPVVKGRFARRPNGWASTVAVKSGFRYDLFGHSPANMPGSHDLDFVRSSLSPSIRFYDLDVITTEDPWVSVAVRSEVVTEDVTSPQEITRSNFDIGTIEDITQDDPQNRKKIRKVWMAMDHLYSKATISFHLVPQYNSLRTIRLTDAKIKTNKSKFNGVCYYYFRSGGLSLPSGTLDTPAVIDLINGATASDSINRNPELPDSVILTTDTIQFAWFCFIPEVSKIPDDLYLEVKYDVMNGDSVIRREQTARNGFPLKTMLSPKAGYNYKITVEVDPSYLYVLWDGDADESVRLTNTLQQ